MSKSRPARAIGERIDPRNIPPTVAFWIDVTDRHLEVVLMPLALPDSYQKSVAMLVRLGVAAYNPDSFQSPVLSPSTENEAARFMMREYAAETAAATRGETYTNRYDAVVRLAESALSRDMPEQGPMPLATVREITTAPSMQSPNIPAPRETIYEQLPQADIIPLANS